MELRVQGVCLGYPMLPTYKGACFCSSNCFFFLFFCASVFLVFARETLFFLRVLCHFCLVFPRENTIFLRIPCHFLRLFWFFRRENTIFLRLSYITLVIPRENPIFLTFSHSLSFHKENIRYLGYSSEKSIFLTFPHVGRISCCSCSCSCCCCC